MTAPRLVLPLVGVMAACSSEPNGVRVDLSIDLATCGSSRPDEIRLTQPGSVGAEIASRSDCRALPADAGRTAEDLPALLSGMALGPVAGDVSVQLSVSVYQGVDRLDCPQPGATGGMPVLSGTSETVRLADSGGLLHLDLACPSGPLTGPRGGLDESFLGVGWGIVDGFMGVSLAVRPDGRVLVGGTTTAGDCDVAQLAADGRVDGDFGVGGHTIFNLTDAATCYFGRLVLDGDLTLVAAASGVGTIDVVAARLDRSGALDATFGGGVVDVDLGMNESPIELTPSGDGTVVLAGTRGVADTRAFLAVRLRSDGTLDPALGGAGWVELTPTGWMDPGLYGLAVPPDGGIVLPGSGMGPTGTSDGVLVRLDRSGAADASFGAEGVVSLAEPGVPDGVGATLSLPDGRLAVFRWVGSPARLEILVVSGTDGSVAGTVSIPLAAPAGALGWTTLGLLPDGGIVLASSMDGELILVEITPDLILDTSFGTGGVLRIRPDAFRFFVTSDMAVAPDGRIVVTGTVSTDASMLDPATFVARFWP